MEITTEDKQLNLKNIKKLVHDHGFPFSKSQSLGEYLSIPPNILTDFRHDFREAERMFSEVIKYWLDNSDDLSWNNLAEALKCCDHKKIADYILKEYVSECQDKCNKEVEVARGCQIIPFIDNQSAASTNSAEPHLMCEQIESFPQIQDGPPPPKKLALHKIQLEQGQDIRRYQYELAEPGLQGRSYMIVAPTGSGKTLVGAIIIADHLNNNMHNSRCHVGFIVPTKPLAEQQKGKLEAYISGVKVGIATGDFNNGVAESMSINDITVCTAGKLFEELRHGKVSVSQFSLLVLDECHHTVKEHPYAQLMKFYLEKKLEAKTFPILPGTQIIGMTASPGSGQSRSPDAIKILSHLKRLMAHLDSSGGIKTVTKCTDELKECSKKSIVECRALEPRDTTNDPFIANVLQVMIKIEQQFFGELEHCRSKRWSQDYLVKVKQIVVIEEVSTGDDCRDRISASQQLYAYGNALSVYMDMRSDDAIKVIRKYAEEFPAADKATPIEKNLKVLNDELLLNISALPPKENPLLNEISDILLKHFQNNRSARAIVFVRMRDHTDAMKEWILNHPNLKTEDIIPGNITGYTRKRDDITRAKQEEVLKQFHQGKVNVLITTSIAEEGLDIPECSLVIRYQHVSNEIAKAQAEGRARAEDSNCYTIISNSSSRKYQELKNAELLAHVDFIIKSGILTSGDLFQKELERRQRDIVEEKKKKEIQQKLRKSNPASSVDLLCKKCKEFACKGSDVRTLYEEGPNHYLVPLPDFKNKFRTKRHHKPGILTDTILKTHKIHCSKCDRDWGVQAVSSVTDDRYPVIKCDSFVFKIGDSCRSIKKWCDVPFEVEPLNKT